MAHRLLTGRESIDTDVKGSGENVFRVVYQSSDANVGSSLFATHHAAGVLAALRELLDLDDVALVDGAVGR